MDTTEGLSLSAHTNRGRPRIQDGRDFDDLSLEEQIERWDRVRKVLRRMSDHAIERHFDMCNWIRVTPCGTIGCAAGQCALDPWFQRRGFGVNIDRGGWRWSGLGPREFFGSDGYDKVFTNDDIMTQFRRGKNHDRLPRKPRAQHVLALRAANQYLKSLKARR